jgi:hypothetical protein
MGMIVTMTKHIMEPSDPDANVDIRLTDEDVKSIIREFIRNRRNMKLGTRFLKYLAITQHKTPEDMYYDLFQESLHEHVRLYL